MDLGLRYDQLAPVAGSVRAGVIPYDARDSKHLALLREAEAQFLGSLAAKHGATFSTKNIDATVAAANAKEIEIAFIYVALDACGPVRLAGLATGERTYGVEWDKNNRLQIVPIYHGEDLSVDAGLAKQFRELTRDERHPNGIGLGSWVMAEQIRQSVSNSYWVYAGRDNEHAPDNQAIIGVMNKFGAIHGTEQDSAILQLDRLTHDMKKRWGVDVVTEVLPTDPLGLRPCPDNFLTRWSSEDGKQQMAVIFRKLPPTSDDETVVWTKIKSNGNLPNGEMLKEVLASLLVAGTKEIANPERLWGVLADKQNDLHRALGGPVPVMHLHTIKEKPIVDALLEMGAIHRKYGKDIMVSGVMDLKNISNPESALDLKLLPEPTLVTGMNLEPAANEPYFDMVSGPARPIKGSWINEKATQHLLAA